MNKKIGRNDPCPCGSGKKYKACCISITSSDMPATWSDGDNTRVLIKGEKPSQAELDQLTKEYQQQIKHSHFWGEMVEQYGEQKAEEMLGEFKAEVK